jgi:hypothetical protein
MKPRTSIKELVGLIAKDAMYFALRKHIAALAENSSIDEQLAIDKWYDEFWNERNFNDTKHS